MKVWYGVLFYGFFMISFLSSYQWPNEKARIVRHFGQNDQGVLRCSLGLDGNFVEVYPVHDGKVLFRHSPDSEAFPTRSSNTILVDQSDGIRVIYEGMDSLNIDLSQKVVHSRSLLGLRIPGKFLSIAFYDSHVFQYANPLLFLPRVIPKFYQNIIFGGLYLTNEQGKTYDAISGVLIPSDTYDVYVNVVEIIDGVKLAPYQVELDFMGDIIASISFDAITASKGQSILRGKKNYFEKHLYNQKGNLFLGKLHLFSGQSFITLRFSSVNGVRRQETIRIVSS